METEPKYKRILLKISGEALAGEQKTGLDFGVIGQVCDVIKACTELGVQVGVVIGGGNFWRGVKNGEGKMARSRADHMGMLATVMNCLAVSDVMEQKGIPVRVQTAVEMSTFAEHYTWERAIAHLEEGKVVLFGAGSGCPYPGAVKYDAITYDEVLAKHLAVMDLTATSLAMENDIPVVVFALADPQNIVRAVMGEPVGTVVTK